MADRVFKIDEILRCFLSYCDTLTLARLARTSKLFSEPALDYLWENLTCFANLLRIFPDHLITWHSSDSSNSEKPVGKQHPLWSVLDPLTETFETVNQLIVPRDWQRVSMYAKRIRRWGFEDLSYIEEPIVDHLAFGRIPGEHLLPRLEHITVNVTDTRSLSGVHLRTLVLGPSVTRISVMTSRPGGSAVMSVTNQLSRALNTFFRTLSDRSPRLRKLTIQWNEGENLFASRPFVDGLADVLLHARELTDVYIWSSGCIDERGLFHLSQLPQLESLQLNLLKLPDHAHRLCQKITASSEAFPKLHDLYIAGVPADLPIVLRAFSATRKLKRISLAVHEYSRAVLLHKLFAQISEDFPALQVLQFSVPPDDIDLHDVSPRYMHTPEEYQIDFEVLRPLLALHELISLCIEPCVPMILHDADLALIADAWPKIETLSLGPDRTCPTYTEIAAFRREENSDASAPVSIPDIGAPTLSGIATFARACSKLTSLSLHVDMRIVSSTSTITSFIRPLAASDVATVFPASNSLLFFGVGNTHFPVDPDIDSARTYNSSIERIAALVASWFSGIFPSLKLLTASALPGDAGGTGLSDNHITLGGPAFGAGGQPQAWGVNVQSLNNSSNTSRDRLRRGLHEYDQGWRMVCELLPVFRAVRENERNALRESLRREIRQEMIMEGNAKGNTSIAVEGKKKRKVTAVLEGDHEDFAGGGDELDEVEKLL